MPKHLLFILSICWTMLAHGQTVWQIQDANFPGLPPSIHVYKTTTKLHGRPHIAWYVEADLSDKSLIFDTDTTYGRRLTPSEFYAKNSSPTLVVNGTFFSFADHKNLNVVMKHKRLLGYNIMSLPGRGKDTLTYQHVTRSALGIHKQGSADIAWLYTDSSRRYPFAFQHEPVFFKDSSHGVTPSSFFKNALSEKPMKWKMHTAIGGGPVLVHDGKMRITNNEEQMFKGKAREDLHPRTAMGYTKDGKLLILAVEGRHPGVANGASLTDLAEMFIELGAVEALNLDGGGSSCLLVMGKETIKPSDKEGQRKIPGVFVIHQTGMSR